MENMVSFVDTQTVTNLLVCNDLALSFDGSAGRILRSSRAGCTALPMAMLCWLLSETTKRSDRSPGTRQHGYCSHSCAHPIFFLAQDMESQEAASRQHQQVRDVDIDDLLDDPELERLHAERVAMLQQENEKRQQLQRKGHGDYQEVEEG